VERSYVDALEEAPEPHRVIFGPAPCRRCGAWVEWAGAQVLNAGTRGTHECAPFLYVGDEVEVVAEWTRPAPPRYAVMQAHPVQPVLPSWAAHLGAGILWVATGLALAFAVALVARYVL
jgi:hypothetical protein